MIGGRRGRPLRFLALVTTGWVTVRAAMLWPQIESPVDVLRAVASIPVAEAEPANAPPPVAAAVRSLSSAPITIATVRSGRRSKPRLASVATRSVPIVAAMAHYGDAEQAETPTPLVAGLPRPELATALPRTSSRWSGSAWLVARGGGSGIAPGVVGGQLGGSQAGVRLAYLLNRRHRVALAGRVTSPLGAGLREAALGVEWQPTRLPLRIVAERRFALSQGRGGPALGVVGGVGPAALPAGFRLEAYGQAGVIRRTATEAYADGAVRVAHPLATIGPARIAVGAGLWGGAQRGAARLDIGPALAVSLPLGKQAVRLALDWRERVAGDARPGSGPALTLGTDF